jgi:hypothetical protein
MAFIISWEQQIGDFFARDTIGHKAYSGKSLNAKFRNILSRGRKLSSKRGVFAIQPETPLYAEFMDILFRGRKFHEPNIKATLQER